MKTKCRMMVMGEGDVSLSLPDGMQFIIPFHMSQLLLSPPTTVSGVLPSPAAEEGPAGVLQGLCSCR